MPPSPMDPSLSGPPYTFTNSVDSNSFSSLFATKSEMNTGQPSSVSLDQASVMASLSSQFATKTEPSVPGPGRASTTLSTSKTTPTDLSASAPAASVTGSSPGATQVPSSSQAATGGPAASSAATSSASTAANNASANDLQRQSSGMSSPGIQAAVAVPIVLVVLAIIVIACICMRRRKRSSGGGAGDTDDAAEKQATVAPKKKKKWSRHLRVFSFDTELLMGGRYSSSNSIRSRQTGSLRSSNRSPHDDSPSVHSVEEVAPPYRDAVSTVQPSIGQVMTGGLAPVVTRSASNATAPPPYGAAAARLASARPTTPQSARSDQNPFADSPPISPIERSPFNDPPGTSPPVSRTSSVRGDDASDAVSIREATLARNASVMSGGRVVEVSRASQ